ADEAVSAALKSNAPMGYNIEYRTVGIEDGVGLSRMYDDDLEQLEAGMTLYDAFYRWCRDATTETHNWPTNKVKA
ncbi:hypothetical protein MOV75_21655, partial [Bradyrhizobium sp. PRIMUS42]|nr:hypothetical protein [Bradyrhizobium sp. PRIMUS42]